MHNDNLNLNLTNIYTRIKIKETRNSNYIQDVNKMCVCRRC